MVPPRVAFGSGLQGTFMGRRPPYAMFAAALLAAAALAVAGPGTAAPMFGGLFGLGRHAPPPGLVYAYRGWRVDASRLRAMKPEAVVKRIDAQLDLVAKTDMRPDVLAYLRTVPIVGDGSPGAEPGRYVRGQGVLVRVRLLDPKKPMVLRQLLYAYQDQKLPGGFANPDVARFRREAVARKAWPQTAAMLQSDPDYFAYTATAYLAGAITREPYNRANLRKTQPAYYDWLGKVLDGGKARG